MSIYFFSIHNLPNDFLKSFFMKSLRVIKGIYVGIDKQFIFWYNHAELFFIISATIGAFIMSSGNKTANTKRIPTQEDLDIFDKIYEKYNDNGFITF